MAYKLLFFNMVMHNNKTFVTPDYMTRFKCIGKNCIDSCCTGWNIDIDKETYKNYINSSENKINLISKKYLVKNIRKQIYHLVK